MVTMRDAGEPCHRERHHPNIIEPPHDRDIGNEVDGNDGVGDGGEGDELAEDGSRRIPIVTTESASVANRGSCGGHGTET